MPKRKTIADVRALGYEVGFAHGSVATEEDALAAAQENASPLKIADEVRTFSAEIAVAAAHEAEMRVALGKMSKEEVAEFVRGEATRAAELALEAISTARADAVSFHERALAIAKGMPDVFVVSGPGVTSLYVACAPDGTGADEAAQELLDALCDPGAHRERTNQAETM